MPRLTQTTTSRATVSLTLRVDPKLYDAIAEAARQRGDSITQWLSDAAREYLRVLEGEK